ncbi:NPCBM/NEW2 domain-containing protein [Deinococcus malanensis]|uniref:NPCBM/NEW2 domain-containing protein n=1 Tax=Deinococcus malanensis TaxID=1706855 RepID=UPI003626B273
MGVDDEVGKRGKVVFQVFLDGTKTYDSGVMKGKDPARLVDLDITGKQELRLVVTDGGNGIQFDHANWAQPKVVCHATTPATTPSIVQMSLDPQELTMFHKHSAQVRATFSSTVNLGSPLDLRLEPAEPGRGLTLQLITTRVDFSSPGTETRDITIAAPNALSNNPADSLAPYRLIASRNGQDVASALVTIDVRALNVKTYIEPTSISGRAGETRRVTVVVTVDPPIDGPVPLQLVFAPQGETSIHFAEIINVSPSRGDGGKMMADMDIRFFDNPAVPDFALSGTFNVQVSVGDIVSYRTPGYGTRAAPIELKLIR